MTAASEPAAQAVHASAAEESRVLFRQVSLVVPRSSAVALVGQPAAAGAFLECLAGTRRLAEGRMRVLGLDPGRRWRLRGRRVLVPSGSELSPLRKRPDLILSNLPGGVSAGFEKWMREGTAAGMALVFAPGRVPGLCELADRVAIFSRGRLIAEGEIGQLLRGFRRIRFVNRLTETRTAFGTELDEFEAVRVRVRGWGIEAVVANFAEPALERLRGLDGVEEVDAEPMTLGEIAEACSEGS